MVDISLHALASIAVRHLVIHADRPSPCTQIRVTSSDSRSSTTIPAAAQDVSAKNRGSPSAESLQGWDTLVVPHIAALSSKSEDLGEEVCILKIDEFVRSAAESLGGS